METFTQAADFNDNPDFHEQRAKSLEKFDPQKIDRPIIEIIKGFNRLACCFTLQCCYGHFLYSDQKNPYNLEPLPISDHISKVEYRIAYVALCIENSETGKALLQSLERIPATDPEYIRFGSALWFWEWQVNSYVLQVEPRRHMTKDKIIVDYQEALHIEKIRNRFFSELEKRVQAQQSRT